MAELRPAPRLPEHLLRNARVLPDRNAILPLLPKGKVIVEIGVALGDFSELILTICEPSHFYAVDTFMLHGIPSLWGRSTSELFGGGTHGDFYRNRFPAALSERRMTVLEGDSAAMLETLPDACLDIAYIDADHSYDAVRRELSIVSRKIRPDGWIIMNDYIMADAGFTNEPYGVIHATNEFMIAENWEMLFLALQSHMFCDVVLRRAGIDAAAVDPFKSCEELASRNAVLERELSALRASTSWRVTAPMRSLNRYTRSTRQE